VKSANKTSLGVEEKQGINGLAAPFPCTPNPRPSPSASLRNASVASLRLLFTFAPECRSASLRNQRSASPEYPERIATIIEPVPHLMNEASPSVICVESGALHNRLLANQHIAVSGAGHKQPTGS
jgi:hypothetical protein